MRRSTTHRTIRTEKSLWVGCVGKRSRRSTDARTDNQIPMSKKQTLYMKEWKCECGRTIKLELKLKVENDPQKEG